MITDNVYACNVEEGDFITLDGEVMGQVTAIDDASDFILFDTKDEDGDVTQLPFGPFDTVVIVASFEDDDITVEDIEVDI